MFSDDGGRVIEVLTRWLSSLVEWPSLIGRSIRNVVDGKVVSAAAVGCHRSQPLKRCSSPPPAAASRTLMTAYFLIGSTGLLLARPSVYHSPRKYSLPVGNPLVASERT